MVLAKPILIPLSIALLISFILFPLAKKFESWKIKKIFAAFLSIFSVILIIVGVIYFFSTQIINLSKEFTDFQDKIINAFADVTVYINNNVSFVENLERDELFNRMKEWLTNSTGFLIQVKPLVIQQLSLPDCLQQLYLLFFSSFTEMD
jgi:predicted PurR-regulated permease PerM